MPMWEWLAKNSSWVFSGAGVAVGMAFLGLLRRWWKGDARIKPAAAVASLVGGDSVASPVAGRDVHQTINIGQVAPAPAAEADSEFSQHPSADEIVKRIEQLPIIQRHKFGRETYGGLKVKWQAAIKFIGRGDTPGAVVLTMFTESRSLGDVGAMIEGTVILEKFPRLKTIHGGERVTIWGTITHANDAGVDVEIERLRFDS